MALLELLPPAADAFSIIAIGSKYIVFVLRGYLCFLGEDLTAFVLFLDSFLEAFDYLFETFLGLRTFFGIYSMSGAIFGAPGVLVPLA